MHQSTTQQLSANRNQPEKGIIMNNSRLTTLFVALAALMLMPMSYGAVLVGYNFNGADGSKTSGDLDGNTLSYGAFSPGSGSVGFSSSSFSMFVRANATGSSETDGDTLLEAITNNAYATFTVTNNGSDRYDLDSLTFDVFFTSPTAPTGSPVSSYSIAGMSDELAFSDGNEFGVYTISSTLAPTTASPVSFALSALSELAPSDSLEFRLYFFDDKNHADPIYRVDNVTVNGTVIPEPSTILLAGLGLTGLVLRRRRR